MASRAVIEVRDLVKYYLTTKGQLVHALQDVTLDIDEGEFVSVVGPSGCGKSTLLKILGGLLPTSAGEVRFRGEPITGPRREFGMVFQNPVLFP
ncbi:MAG: ATP-binding cassette domain-containing protein, partial [Deltaproteobacteria bacterium]|nr:ATP-binding cassette domain-containing protein [Deltaproteobacteria bacterium]